MWPYRLAFFLGEPLRLHERVSIGEQTDPTLRRLVAECYYRQGRALQGRGQVDRALLALQRGALVFSEHPALHGTVGVIFVRWGRPLEAVPWLERAVELDPRQAEWRLLLAQAFEDTGRPGEAVRHYRAALALDPALVPAREGAGRLASLPRARAAGPQPWQEARSRTR